MVIIMKENYLTWKNGETVNLFFLMVILMKDIFKIINISMMVFINLSAVMYIKGSGNNQKDMDMDN